jgi:hypothetical protein
MHLERKATAYYFFYGYNSWLASSKFPLYETLHYYSEQLIDSSVATNMH